MKENCSPYMLGCRARLGYFPNGGTIRLNTRAMQTNTAGRTIWKKIQWRGNFRKTPTLLIQDSRTPEVAYSTGTLCAWENSMGIPEQRSLSWSAEHRGIVSKVTPQIAVSSDSSLWPGTNLYHLFHWASQSHGILQTDTRRHVSKYNMTSVCYICFSNNTN